MTQTQERETTPLAAEYVEQILTRAGGRLGTLAGQAMLRFRQATRAFRGEAIHMDVPSSARQAERAGRNATANHARMDKAEALVDQLGERVGHWALLSSLQVRQATARLQEEAEDMWVEAQELRNEWKEKR